MKQIIIHLTFAKLSPVHEALSSAWELSSFPFPFSRITSSIFRNPLKEGAILISPAVLLQPMIFLSFHFPSVKKMSEQKSRLISSWDSPGFSSCPQNKIECAYQLMTWVDICKSFRRQAVTGSIIIVEFLLIVECFFLPFLIFLKKQIG